MIDSQVYEGLHDVAGPRRTSCFKEEVVRPHVLYPDLEAAYADKARHEEREQEGLEWTEATLEYIDDEMW